MVAGSLKQRSPRSSATVGSPVHEKAQRSFVCAKDPAEPIFGLSQTLGNQAMQRLLRSGVIQAKLAISHPGDPYEQEADRVADQVLRMPEPAASERVTAPASGEEPRIQRMCAGCEEEEEEAMAVQAKTAPGHTPDVAPGAEAQVNALQGGGQPLPPSIRAFFEPRFGRDFSQVRIHTDSRAAESARAVNALGYTLNRNVVFGAGQYAPETVTGQQLLAHELTHVVQQTERPSSGDVQTSVSLQRQQAPAAAGPQSWASCPSDEISDLNEELSEAVNWVQGAIDDLQASDRPARTNGALARYLTSDSAHISSTILPNLQAILADLNLGATNFRCQTEQQCLAAFPGGAVAYSGNPITLCPEYFDEGRLDRITTLIHESGHNAGLAGNVVEWQWPFPGLSVTRRLGNTESYAAFVRSNRYPALPPYQGPLGIQLGAGILVPGGGAEARWLVTAELDVIPRQRIFRFLDLHAGVRVDVDESGTVLGSAVVGTRMFAPLDLTRVPLYLDLRAGFVVGVAEDVGPRFERIAPSEAINVLGPSGEARIGILSGHFGASMGYRHIFNLVRDNPDLDEVVIRGEIRF